MDLFSMEVMVVFSPPDSLKIIGITIVTVCLNQFYFAIYSMDLLSEINVVIVIIASEVCGNDAFGCFIACRWWINLVYFFLKVKTAVT